jgi:hypothetical protein
VGHGEQFQHAFPQVKVIKTLTTNLVYSLAKGAPDIGLSGIL